jgi:hypothetical protein
MFVVCVQYNVALERMHQSDEQVHHAGQSLLYVGRLLLGSLQPKLVHVVDHGRIAHMIDGFLGRQKSGAHPVVHVLALEPYPVALPSRLLERVVAVPLAGEEQEQVAGLGCASGTEAEWKIPMPSVT